MGKAEALVQPLTLPVDTVLGEDEPLALSAPPLALALDVGGRSVGVPAPVLLGDRLGLAEAQLLAAALVLSRPLEEAARETAAALVTLGERETDALGAGEYEADALGRTDGDVRIVALGEPLADGAKAL